MRIRAVIRQLLPRELPVIALIGSAIGCALAPPAEQAAVDPIVQVLATGPDAGLLQQAIETLGGTVTHNLPIVSGIGGTLRASQLQALLDSEGVAKIVEDANPPTEPEPRGCALDGALEIDVTDRRIGWRLFNFAESALPITVLEIAYPAALGPITGVFLGDNPLPLPEDGIVDVTGQGVTVPMGITPLVIEFSHVDHGVEQSALSLSVATPECVAKLVPAYPDNAGDFYYARAVGANALHTRGITGKGVTVAVVDSGLWEAPPLAMDSQNLPRVVARFDAIHNRDDAPVSDESGHGTHMASVLAHSGAIEGNEDRGFKGIAPDVRLIPIKVFDATGNGDFLDILRGIQWVIANRERYDIQIMNLSLAAIPRFPYWDDPINQAVLKAWQAGITVVVAAGNDGPEWGSIGSPGNNPYVITVGAVTDSWTADDYRDDYVPDFSSRGPTPVGHVKPDVVAPGGHMTGLTPSTSTMAKDNPNWFLRSGDFVSTGSSQASALVAGLSALLLELEPTLTNNEIKCLLLSSAKPAINRNGQLSYSPFTQGAGYVDIARAVTLGERACGNEGMDIDAAVAGTERLYGPAEIDSDGSPTLPHADSLVSQQPSETGLSEQRRWGVKAHIERLDADSGEQPQTAGVPTDWGALYEQERARVRELQSPDIKNR